MNDLYWLKLDLESEINNVNFDNSDEVDNSFEYVMSTLRLRDIKKTLKDKLDKIINDSKYPLEQAYFNALSVINKELKKKEKIK